MDRKSAEWVSLRKIGKLYRPWNGKFQTNADKCIIILYTARGAHWLRDPYSEALYTWTVKSYAMLYRIVWYGKMIDYLAKLNENFNWCWTIYIFLQADRKYWMKLVEKSMDGVQKVRVRIERDESFGNFSWIFFCRSLHGRLSSSRLFHLLEYFSMHIFWKDSTIPSISANCTVTTALHKHDYKATSKWTCIWDSSCLLQ